MGIELTAQGDAIQLMRHLPDGVVDMLFTDPPYGTTRNKWDKEFDLDGFWAEATRVCSRNACIAIWAQPPFSFVLGASNPRMFRYEWIVEKGNATGFLNSRKMPMKAHECVLIFYRSLPTYNPQMTHGHERKVTSRKGTRTTCYNPADGATSYDSTDRYPRDVLGFSWDKQKSSLHPTQKPLAACEYFIKTYTDPGMTVLDPFMGSGTTGAACRRLGRSFIGFELDSDYARAAQDRIAAERILTHE